MPGLPVQHDLPEFHYRLARLAHGLRPGQHRSSQRGDGLEPVTHVELLHGRDPRRLDLLASARDPLRRLLMRSARPRVSIPVYLLADLSASMAAGERRLEMLADLAGTLAWSAYRSGDSFAFFGCDEAVRPEFTHPLGRSRGAGMDIAARLRAFEPEGRGADGLLTAAGLVRRSDALVFVASDFHLPEALLRAVLAALSRVQLVPIVLADSREDLSSAGFGIARLRDAEDAGERLVLLTRAMREALRRRAEERRQRLAALFRRHGTAGLWLTDRFDADRITRHFHG